MNAAFSMWQPTLKTRINDVVDPKWVLLFDGLGGRNRFGNLDDVQFRHDRGIASFLLVEGNVKQFDRKKAAALQWDN